MYIGLVIIRMGILQLLTKPPSHFVPSSLWSGDSLRFLLFRSFGNKIWRGIADFRFVDWLPGSPSRCVRRVDKASMELRGRGIWVTDVVTKKIELGFVVAFLRDV
jgi:hypothetical protein